MIYPSLCAPRRTYVFTEQNASSSSGGSMLKSCRNVPNLAAKNQQMLTLRGNYSQNSVWFPVLRHCRHASSLKGLLPNGTAPSRNTGDKRALTVLTVLTTTCHVLHGNFMNSCHICHVDHLKIICMMVQKNLAICIKTFKILWYTLDRQTIGWLVWFLPSTGPSAKVYPTTPSVMSSMSGCCASASSVAISSSWISWLNDLVVGKHPNATMSRNRWRSFTYKWIMNNGQLIP